MDEMGWNSDLMKALKQHARSMKANRIKNARQKMVVASEACEEPQEMSDDDIALLVTSLGGEK